MPELPDVAEEVEQDQDNAEFDAAFAESAKISEVEKAEDAPGEVGADDAGDESGAAFENSFTDAAVNSAASKGETADVDLVKRLAEMEAETERLKQSERSQRGRVSALTKKLVEQRAAMEPPRVEQEQEAGAEGDDDWEEFKLEFPEMAAIVDKRLNKVAKQVDSVNERVERVSTTQDTLVEKEITAYKETQFEILAEKHPDFDAIKVSPEFAQFKAEATPDIQAKIKSKHAEDAIAVLDEFKRSSGWGGSTTRRQGKSEIELINERRAATLRQSQGISSKKVGHSAKKDTGSDDDFDAAFAEGASKKEKERSLRA